MRIHYDMLPAAALVFVQAEVLNENRARHWELTTSQPALQGVAQRAEGRGPRT